jgi:hypothetical protein
MMYVRYPLSLRNVEDLLATPWVASHPNRRRAAICAPIRPAAQTWRFRKKRFSETSPSPDSDG